MTTLAESGSAGRYFRRWFIGTVADRLLLLLSLMAIAVAWQWIYSSVGSGPPMVMIYHDNQLLARYPVPDGQQTIRFDADGDLGISEIEIDSHGAHFVSSPCSSHYCVSRGHRREHGDVIACVPNRIMIAIQGSNDSSELDAVVE